MEEDNRHGNVHAQSITVPRVLWDFVKHFEKVFFEEMKFLQVNGRRNVIFASAFLNDDLDIQFPAAFAWNAQRAYRHRETQSESISDKVSLCTDIWCSAVNSLAEWCGASPQIAKQLVDSSCVCWCIQTARKCTDMAFSDIQSSEFWFALSPNERLLDVRTICE